MVWWLAPGFSAVMAAQSAPVEADDTARTALGDLASSHGLQAACLWSVRDGFYHFSTNWQRITGLNEADCFEQRWFSMFTSDAMREWQQAICDLSSPNPAERIDTASVEIACLSETGEAVWLHVTLVPQGRGKSNGYCLLVSNITQQKMLEDAADLARHESAMAHSGRGAFLSNMSHELRTPLNAILGFAQMLEHLGQASPQQYQEYLAHIRESGEDLLGKINDLLEVANIDADQHRLREGQHNLTDLIDAAIEMRSHAAHRVDVRLCQPERPRPAIIVRADRARLIHALSNLLGEAIGRCERGGVIQIDWRVRADKELAITIEDDGCGFAHKHLGNLKAALRTKRPYYRTDIDHISLPTATAQTLLMQHGGQLGIEYCPKSGTCTTLTLPQSRVVVQGARIKAKKKVAA